VTALTRLLNALLRMKGSINLNPHSFILRRG